MQSKNITRHRTPTSVKASDVQYACNFAQGKAWPVLPGLGGKGFIFLILGGTVTCSTVHLNKQRLLPSTLNFNQL